MRVGHLRLRSEAPDGIGPARGGGAVLDPGDAERGRHEGVRVRVDGPAWLVLGESYNSGWRAACDGRDLGEPEVVDGYANGWHPAGRLPSGRAEPSGPSARSPWATRYRPSPARPCSASCWWAAAAAPASRGGRPGRRRPLERHTRCCRAMAVAPGGPCRPGCRRGVRLPVRVRAGPPIGLGVGLVLWRGVGSRALVAAAVVALAVVVPAIYVIFPAEDRGGYNSGYAQDILGAHWVGVAAFVLLFLALARSLSALSTATDRRGAREHAPPASASPRSQA